MNADTTATATDSVLFITAGGTLRTVSLPTAVGIAGRVYTVKLMDLGFGATVDPAGAETIDGAATVDVCTQWDWVSVISNGPNGNVLGQRVAC